MSDAGNSEAPQGIDRRTFLHSAALAGITLTSEPGRRSVVPAAEAGPGESRAADFELEEATIAGLQEGMRAGKHTSRSVTRAYLERIEALDRRGPALRQVLETNPDALEIAAQRDAERRAGRIRGPLHGIPVLLKDNVDTADRLTTTAGSLALEGSVAPRDAFVAERMRAAGAVILGKTNLSEWANFRSTRSSSGWSGRGGQGRNPYALDRSPCGSSSGSAGAVAANYAAAAIGTETDGSIVCPAAANSLVGIKPTLGLVSRSGIVPIAHSQDTAGPMTRTVADAAILLGALTGADPRDPETAKSRGRAMVDYTRFLDPAGLKGARLGIARARLFGYSEEMDRVANEAIEVLKRQGAEVVDPADIPHLGEYDDSEFTVLLYEFKDDLNRYLAGLGPGARIRSLKDAIEFNERNRDREMPYFGQEIFHMAQEKGPLTDRAYRDALAKNHRLSRAEGIDAVMRKHRLDAIVGPTGHPPHMIDLVNGDHFLGGSSTAAAVAGYPHITVPAGYVFGLPVGISFIGQAWSEPTLIRLAYAFEQATKHRKAPRFLPTAELGER